MPVLLTNLDLAKNQLLNALAQVLGAAPGSPAEGQFYYDSTAKVLSFRTNTGWIALGRLDQITGPTAAVAFNAQKITGLADPQAAQDAATKAYVDSVAAGLAWKASVRVASVANVSVSSAPAAVDGVTLAANDRVLLKNQTAPAENGIWVFASAGAALTRATDADTAAEILQAAVFVQEGTNADSAWTLTTNAPITIGTTGLVFTQFNGASYSAGAGLTLTGATIDVGAGTGIQVNADNVQLVIPVAVSSGGTGGTTAPTARAALGAIGRFAADIGNGALTSIPVAHNLGTLDVHVAVFRKSDNVEVLPDVVRTDINTVTLGFAIAPTLNQYRAIVLG